MGNTLTCTSPNKEDRVPKNNAPTERPAGSDEEDISKEGTTSAEGSSFIKNINVRKSLRAARKSVVKPFKKVRNRNKDKTKEGLTSIEVTNGEVLSDTDDQVSTIEVETHSEAPPEVEAPIDAAVPDAAVPDTTSIQITIEDAPSKAEAEVEKGSDADGEEPPVSDEEKVEISDQVETPTKDEVPSEDREESQSDAETKVDVDDQDGGSEKTEESPPTDEVNEVDGDADEKKQKARINEALFNKYDKDGSGALKRSEIKRLLKSELGLDREEASIMQLLIDEDDSHEVSLAEFQEFMDKEDNVSVVTDSKSYKLLAEALKIFKQHDSDGSGKLTKDELGSLLQNDLGIPAEQAESVLMQYDTTGDQEIGFLEFVKFLPPTSHLIE